VVLQVVADGPVGVGLKILVVALIVSLNSPTILKALLHKTNLLFPIDRHSTPVVTRGQVSHIVVRAILTGLLLGETFVEIVVERPEHDAFIHILSGYQFVQAGLVESFDEDAAACQFE